MGPGHEGKEGVAVCVASGGNLLASESCFQADSDWSIDVDYGEATLLDSRDLRVVTAVFRSALVGMHQLSTLSTTLGNNPLLVSQAPNHIQLCLYLRTRGCQFPIACMYI